MEQRLSQKQIQTLAMTQSLRQSLEILNFSTYELECFLVEKQQENPCLKVRSKGPILTSTHSLQQIESQSSHKDMLYSQMLDFQLSDELARLIRWLIDDLNEDGFLTATLEEYAKWTNKPVVLIEEAIDVIQQFEPVGIGAFSKKHALILQAIYHGFSLQTIDIITNYFDLFITKRWKELSKKMIMSLEEIQQISDTLGNFSLSPMQQIKVQNPRYIRADAIVLFEKEELIINYYGHAFPQITIDKEYLHGLPVLIDSSAMAYVKQKSNEVTNLASQLKWRKSTLQRIIYEVVHRQHRYFTLGSQFLIPLTMTDLAEVLNLHESTVSRAVRDKYLETKSGVVSLKSFFSQPSTDDISATHVKARIQFFIQQENKSNPLSDLKIVDMLKQERIHLSRRVIAKYRDQLGILSSTKRKRFERKEI
ncbi:RNA polymerase factor sigma-54 [Paenisporosarcina sp. TG20]|uniref:RNA polymerase factor sigma-54 n=1 Tax=Paenisporosarcina sp. TG20 TaxID=1211706 RepID=UPI00030AEECD|nr:RNA polymerase factor sigma-54 [Paenisporosarcina sp. TG20]